jgi:hypothetical protein
MELKGKKMTPAIVFRTNSHECLHYARKFSRRITDEENKKYPTLLKERMKQQSRARVAEKQIDQMKLNDKGEKHISKLMMNGIFDKINDIVADVSICEPHPDFIMNSHIVFTNYMIEQWHDELKFYFPRNSIEYHYLIDLLWRGVGVYSRGLPDAYLHIVQNLACNGMLGLVFSDESLMFGVSMPFRTSVIIPDDALITDKHIMEYHQMSGRAGRRGLDKEGHVIILGRTGAEIKQLTVSKIPDVIGRDTMFFGCSYAQYISSNTTWGNIKMNYLLNKITPEDATDFYKEIDMNLLNGWKFASKDQVRIICNVMQSDNKSFFHMLWKLRHTEDCFRVPYIITFMRKIFRNINVKNETTQVQLALFLSQYIDVIEGTDNILPPFITTYDINSGLETLGLGLHAVIDGKLYESIHMNKLIDCNINDKSILRERLLNFGEKIQAIQHYYFYSKEKELAQLLAKLMTRMWWIYHNSSPVMESIMRYDE